MRWSRVPSIPGCAMANCAACVLKTLTLDAGAVLVSESKATGARHVFLNDEGMGFFEGLAAGRDGGDPLFQHKGRAWGPTGQTRPMRAACATASIEDASFPHPSAHLCLAVLDGRWRPGRPGPATRPYDDTNGRDDVRSSCRHVACRAGAPSSHRTLALGENGARLRGCAS